MIGHHRKQGVTHRRNGELLQKLRRWFWEEKLNNWPGFVALGILSGVAGWITVRFGSTPGMLILAVLVAVPTVYAVVTYPKFGILMLISSGFALFFVLRIGISFPIGTLIDGLQALLLLGFFVSQRKKPDWEIYRNPISLVILIWLLYNLFQVGNPWAESRLAWLYTVRSMGTVVLMYFVFLYQINSVAYVRILVRFWLVLALIGALYGYKQEYMGFGDREFAELTADPLTTSLLFINGHWRKYSIFSDPVAFSYNMVAAFLICLALLRIKKGRALKIFLAIVAALCVTSMFFSGTRGAYVLIPAGLVLFIILSFSLRLIPFIAVAAGIMVIMIFMPTSNATLYRFQTAFRPSDDASYSVRETNQKLIRPYIQSHPFGGGLGATGVWGVRFAPNSYLATFPPDSGFMRVAAELGWVGLFIFCVMIFVVLKTGIDNYYRIRSPELKYYCLAMTLVVFVFCIGSFPQEAFVQYPANILFYLAAAIIQVTYRLDTSRPLAGR